MFVEGQIFRVKRQDSYSTGKTCRFLSVNMVELCFVYMKEATLTSNYSALNLSTKVNCHFWEIFEFIVFPALI